MKRIHWNILFLGIAVLSLGLYIYQSIASLKAAGVEAHPLLDDAFMITRYAKHWLAGEGFSWNAVDGPAYGVTSPAYLFLITAVLGSTKSSDSVALTYTSYVAGLLSVLTLAWLGFLVQEDKERSRPWLPLLAVPLVLLPPFGFHSLTGMETTFSLLANSLLACSIVIAARRRSRIALPFCLLAGFLAFITRPDNGVYALSLPPLFFLSVDRSMWKYAIQYALFFILLAGLSLVMNKFLFNDFLPLPFFAKSSGFYQGYLGVTGWNAMEQMLDFLASALPCILLIAMTASKSTLPRLAAIAIPVALTFAYYATVTQIMGWVARYYYPSMAFVFLAAFTAVLGDPANSFLQTSNGEFRRRLLLGGAALIPIVLLLAFKEIPISLWERSVIGRPSSFHSLTTYRTSREDPLPSLGWSGSILSMEKLLQHLPEGTVITASEDGWIGSQLPRLTIIDLIGLHDRSIVHDGFSAVYVLSRRPDLIWFPHSDYTYEVAQLLDDPAFIRDYEYYPGAWDYGIALNKRSRLYTTIKSEAEREFSRVYPGLNLSDYLAKPETPGTAGP